MSTKKQTGKKQDSKDKTGIRLPSQGVNTGLKIDTELPKLSTMQRLRDEGRLDENGKLKPENQGLFGRINQWLRESAKDRSIPTALLVQAPKANLLIQATIEEKIDRLTDEVRELKEMLRK